MCTYSGKGTQTIAAEKTQEENHLFKSFSKYSQLLGESQSEHEHMNPDTHQQHMVGAKRWVHEDRPSADGPVLTFDHLYQTHNLTIFASSSPSKIQLQVCHWAAALSPICSETFFLIKATLLHLSPNAGTRYASKVSCRHTGITGGCCERQGDSEKGMGYNVFRSINFITISSARSPQKTANRQAPSGLISAGSLNGQHKCVRTWPCTRYDTHKCTCGWSGQVNATEIGLERQLRLCATICTKTS